MSVTERQQLSYIAGQAADARLNVELETEGMTLNIGPQHPATHGTLRIVCRLDGEQVVWADPSCGYMHRGYEKLTEVRTYPQVTTLKHANIEQPVVTDCRRNDSQPQGVSRQVGDDDQRPANRIGSAIRIDADPWMRIPAQRVQDRPDVM